MELDTRSVASEPASPLKSPGEEKMEVTSELSSSDWQSRDSGFFERGIKTMLSIRKSKLSLKKERRKEDTGTWNAKRLLQTLRSYEENKPTICNSTEKVGEICEPIEAKPLSGKTQNHQCHFPGRINVTIIYSVQGLGPTEVLKSWAPLACWCVIQPSPGKALSLNMLLCGLPSIRSAISAANLSTCQCDIAHHSDQSPSC